MTLEAEVCKMDLKVKVVSKGTCPRMIASLRRTERIRIRPGEFGRRIAQSKNLTHVINSFDLGQLGDLKNVAVHGGPREPTTPNSGLDTATESLHGECPITPDRARILDTRGDM